MWNCFRANPNGFKKIMKIEWRGGNYICEKAVISLKTMREANGAESHYEMMFGSCKWLFLVSEVAKLSHGSVVAMAIICNCAENPQNS